MPVPQGIFSAVSYSSLASTFALALLSQLCKGIEEEEEEEQEEEERRRGISYAIAAKQLHLHASDDHSVSPHRYKIMCVSSGNQGVMPPRSSVPRGLCAASYTSSTSHW